VRHVFLLRNDTLVDWKLARTEKSCNCSVAKLSNPVVAANTTESITLEYRAGDKSHDDSQTIDLFFDGPRAPVVSLRAKATVRPELAATCEQLRFHLIRGTDPKKQSFEVHNYSDYPWEMIEVQSSESWLRTSLRESDRLAAERAGPRQIWQVTVAVNTAELGGEAEQSMRGELLIRPIHRAEPQQSVVVDLVVQEKIRVVPTKVFFPSVKPGVTSTRKVLFFCAETDAPQELAKPSVKHDLGESLSWRWFEAWIALGVWMSRYWSRRERCGSCFRGQLVVSFDDPRLRSFEIPCTASILPGG